MDIVSAEFRVIYPKLCRKCTFPQNLPTRKLGEIFVIYAGGTFSKTAENLKMYYKNEMISEILVLSQWLLTGKLQGVG